MLGNYFYHGIIRKTVVSFGTLFNNIQLVKKDPTTGDVIRQEKVPIAYGPKAKFLAKIQQDPTLQGKINITMPRLSFEMIDLSYDASRKTSLISKYLKESSNPDTAKVQYMPVPYNVNFELGILSKSQDDALQILEQILPYFQPAFTVTVNMIPEMDEKRDIPIVLNGINMEDSYEDDLMSKREIVYTLSFTAKTYLYGPVVNAEVIKKATVYETLGDLQQHKRSLKYEVTPQAEEDYNDDGVIDADDNPFIMPDDDFGFNEGIELL